MNFSTSCIFPCSLTPLSVWQAWQRGALPISVLQVPPASQVDFAVSQIHLLGRWLHTIQEDNCCLYNLFSLQEFSFSWLSWVKKKPQQLHRALSDHFQFRLSLSIFTPTRPAMHVDWLGRGKLFSSTQPIWLAHRVKVPLCEMPPHARVIELPSCMPLNVLIFFPSLYCHHYSSALNPKHYISEGCKLMSYVFHIKGLNVNYSESEMLPKHFCTLFIAFNKKDLCKTFNIKCWYTYTCQICFRLMSHIEDFSLSFVIEHHLNHMSPPPLLSIYSQKSKGKNSHVFISKLQRHRLLLMK